MQIALQAKMCDSLVTEQDHAIQTGLKYEAAQDSVLRLRSRMIVNLENDNSDWQQRFNNQVALTTIQKKKKRKWFWITVGVAALGVYTNLP